MKPVLTFVILATVAAAPLARGQGVLDKTTLGKPQNDAVDLQNSLVPGSVKYGKGEKKSQVSAAELKSKSIKDSTFGGSLLNIGIDSGVPKLDESKLRSSSAEAEKQSTASKQKTAAIEKDATEEGAKQPARVEKEPETAAQPAENQPVFSNLSTTATLADNLAQSEANAGLTTSEPKTSTSKPATSSAENAKDHQSATTSAEKSSSPKPNNDP